MHPRKKDEELITVQRMERILRERNISSKSFHVKVSGKNNARSFHGEYLAAELYCPKGNTSMHKIIHVPSKATVTKFS